MPDVGNPVYTAMVASIQEVARIAGVRLLLHSTGADAEDELAMVRDLRHRYVDGLILASPAPDRRSTPRELSGSAAPVVVIGRPTDGHLAWTPCGPTRAEGRAEAVRHLHAVGRTADRVRQRADAHRPRARRAGSATSTASARAGCRATRR